MKDLFKDSDIYHIFSVNNVAMTSTFRDQRNVTILNTTAEYQSN